MRILKKALWPSRVVINEYNGGKVLEIENWLEESMGRVSNRWNIVYNFDNTHFYFRDSKDSFIFSLRWT